MTPVKVLFGLVARYAPLDDASHAKSLNEAIDWWNEIRVDDDAPVPTKPLDKLLVKYKKWAGKWYGVVFHGIMYILLVRWIQDFMSGKDDVYASKYVD